MFNCFPFWFPALKAFTSQKFKKVDVFFDYALINVPLSLSLSFYLVCGIERAINIAYASSILQKVTEFKESTLPS